MPPVSAHGNLGDHPRQQRFSPRRAQRTRRTVILIFRWGAASLRERTVSKGDMGSWEIRGSIPTSPHLLLAYLTQLA